MLFQVANNNHTDAVTNFFETTEEKVEEKVKFHSVALAMHYLTGLKTNTIDQCEYEAIVHNRN